MSILDTPREYKKPVEDIARALYAERMRVWQAARPEPHPLMVSWESDNESFREQLRHEARAIIARLNALGFISPLGQDALKAEAMAAKEGK